MPKREIATTIAVEGEKAFKTALADAAREMRVLGSELKVASAEFETNGNKQAFLTSKSKILSRELEQQKIVVSSLETAMQSATAKFGAGSKEADSYAIQLNNAKAKAAGLQKQLNDTNKELEDMDDGMEDAAKESRSFGRTLERNVEEPAEDSEKALKGLGGELLGMRDALDEIRNMQGVQLGMDIAGGVVDAASALFDYTNEAREYNRQLAMLEVNAGNAKIDYRVAEEEAFEAASYIGDLDSAMVGVNALLAAGLDTTRFVQSMDLLTGAALRFPDTLKFESLADGLQETLATGQGAGQFAELLERLGVDMDEFNTGLAAAKTQGDEVDYTLTYLSQHGLANAKLQFGENNKAMVGAEAATLRLEKAWKSFGETLDPIVTVMANAAAGALEWASNALSPETREELNTQAMERLDAVDEGGVTLGEYWQLYTQGIGAAFGSVFGGGEKQDNMHRHGGASFDVADDITTELEDAADDAATSGAAIPANLSAGIDEAAPLAIASTESMVDQVQTLLDSVTIPNYAAAAAGMLGGAGGAMMLQATVNLNGRKVGQMMTPIISTNQARQMGG